MLSPAAQQEFRKFAFSESFRIDMDALRQNRLHAFVREGVVDIDDYLAFVGEFNEFIGHEPKPLTPIIDRNMRL